MCNGFGFWQPIDCNTSSNRKNDTNLDDLSSSVDAGDWEKAQAAAHTIKGIAANLSLTELFNQSLDVETQVKGQSCKPESLEALKACFKETVAAAEKVIVQYA